MFEPEAAGIDAEEHSMMKSIGYNAFWNQNNSNHPGTMSGLAPGISRYN